MGMMIHRWKLRQSQEIAPHNEVKSSVNNKEENEGVIYTKDEINSLPFFSLKKVASSYDIDVKGKKGNELKDELIKKLGL